MQFRGQFSPNQESETVIWRKNKQLSKHHLHFQITNDLICWRRCPNLAIAEAEENAGGEEEFEEGVDSPNVSEFK